MTLHLDLVLLRRLITPAMLAVFFLVWLPGITWALLWSFGGTLSFLSVLLSYLALYSAIITYELLRRMASWGEKSEEGVGNG